MDEKTLGLIEKVLDEPSCYPEFERKSRDARKAELIDWYEKFGEVNLCYNLYGLDRVCSVPCDRYLDRGLFRKQRHDVNARFFPSGSSFPYDYTLIMRDKLAFEMFMQSMFGESECYCPSVAYLIGSDLYEHSVSGGCRRISAEELIRRFDGQKMVFKQTFGFSGDGVRVVRFENGAVIEKEHAFPAQDFVNSISAPNVSWLIQHFIRQHEILSSLNESSVNTMRVVTFHTGKDVTVACTALRIGGKGADVDNVGQGGVMTGVDENGCLDNDLFSYRDKSRKINPYAGLQLPYFQQALDLVCEAHSFLPALFTVGWDVAFCPNGPLILEGNDGWDSDIAQTPTHKALRAVWDSNLTTRNTVFPVK